MTHCKVRYFAFLLFVFATATVNAAEFRLVANESSPSVYILIAGDIVEGDHERFIQQSRLALGILKKNAGSKHELSVAINSPGGNLAEAIQMGMAIREMRLATMIGAPFEISKGIAGNHCMSACLFILAGGITRDITSLDFSRVKVGIHRPSFDAAYYASLSVEKAEKKFKTLERVSRQYLVDMGISESFVRRMFAIPSTEMKFLDEESFRIEFGQPPFYQEWTIANCGRALSHVEEESIVQYALAIAKEKRPSVSAAYAQQLTVKDKDYRECYRRIRLADQVDSMQKYLNYR